MMTFLTFQHGYLQLLDLSPACLQFTSIVAIPYEIIRIIASAVCTLPMNFSWLLAYLTQCPFLSSYLDCDFSIQTCHQYFSVRYYCCGLHSLLNGFYHVPTLLPSPLSR